MTVKHSKFLFATAVVATLIGAFLFSNSILEFTNVLQTKAHTVTQTIGVQLSYLIFINTLLLLATGVISIVYRNTLKLINLRMFMGIISLAWPLFLSVTLFFTQLKINIRLLILVVVALVYVIAVLVVKITNFEVSKGIKFNPSAVIAQSGKRNKSVDINAIMNSSTGKKQSRKINHTLEHLAANMKANNVAGKGLGRLYAGKQRRLNTNIFKGLYAKKRGRGRNPLASLLQTSQRGRRARRRR